MSPIVRNEDSQFDRQLNRLNYLNQLISEVASVILQGNDGYETVWNIANRVYDRHCSSKLRFMTRSGLDEPRTALSA
jgi:hypothetical protein